MSDSDDALPDDERSRSVSLRRVVGLAIPHWRKLAVATVALFVGSGVVLLYPQAARLLIDDVLADTSDWNMTTIGVGLGFLFILQAFFVGLRHYLFTVVGERIVADLRSRVYRSVIGQEIGFFDAEKTGDITSRLTSDTQTLQNTVTSNVSMALRYGVQAFGGIAAMVFTSYRLAAVMLLTVPPVVIAAVYYGRKLRSLSSDFQDTLADSTSLAEEALAGIRTVRGFGRENHEIARYDEAIEESFRLANLRAKLGGIFSGGVTFLGYFTIGLILLYGGYLVTNDALTPGELTAFILYTLMVAFALAALSGLWTDFMKATGAARRVFELIDRLPKLEVPDDPVHERLEGHVKFDAVDFRYPTRPDRLALEDVTFSVEPGEKLALVGPSGAGKSTIANLLLRFYDPDAGTVLIDGSDLRNWEPEHLRAHTGVVSQEPVLFSGTVRENVLYGDLDASDERVVDALKAANAWEFVSEFEEGLETIVGERGVRLSGGQKQRVAIARALLKDPTFLILDEATSSLDVKSEALVQEALERLMRDRTTLIIAHRLSTVSNADRIVVLDRGRVVETGSHGELLDRGGLYYELIETQRLSA
jgi:ATP-binding cassette subfamily B protein